MPLTTQFAPLSKVLSIMLPTVVMTGGLYSLFRSSWPSVSTLTSEWEQASKASYSSFVSTTQIAQIHFTNLTPAHTFLHPILKFYSSPVKDLTSLPRSIPSVAGATIKSQTHDVFFSHIAFPEGAGNTDYDNQTNKLTS